MLVANTSWYLYNFRLPLARRIRQEGLDVVLVAPNDSYVARLRAEGFEWRELKQLSRRGMNPFMELVALWELMSLYWREKPTAVHHFTIKCVLYGTIAAKLTGIKSVVNAITGLGHMFIGQKLVTRIVRPLVRWVYRKVLSARRVHVVFQNPDDLETFVDAGLVNPQKTVLIRGSGVCLQRFVPRPGDPDLDSSRIPVILLASRLLQEKGILEYVEAARIVKSQRECCFQLAGDIDAGNPSAITEAQLESWRMEGAVDVLGHVDGIEHLLSEADIVTLPSYREGTPKILLEAAAMGKPIVATDVPGCREVVQDGENGYLVPAKDPAALAQAIIKIIDDPQKAREMGLKGRRLVEAEFCVNTVINKTLQVYRNMGVM